MLGDASLLELTECTAIPRRIDSSSTRLPRSTDGALLKVHVARLVLLVHAAIDVALKLSGSPASELMRARESLSSRTPSPDSIHALFSA